MAMTDERHRPSDGPEPSDSPGLDAEAPKPGPAVPASGGSTVDRAGADLDRRNFFRVFSRDAFNAAAGVVGAADAVRKGTAAAAVELLGLAADPQTGADRLAFSMASASFVGRSPYRLDGERLIVLDQRRLPGDAVEVVCQSGAEVATLIRDGAVLSGPVLAPLAAYAMVRAAERNVASRPFVRQSTLRGTANALRNARPDAAAIGVALRRLAPHWEPTTGSDGHVTADSQERTADGHRVADALRAEADAIAFELMAELGQLVEGATALLPQPSDRPLRVTTIGATGPMSAGVIGTATGVLAAMAATGRPIQAWQLEGRPGRFGVRIGALELQAADVPVTIIADGAAGWLFREQPIDAVLVGALRIAADGSVANDAGTYPLAALANRHGVPVYVCAPSWMIDTSVATGEGLAIVMRGRQELLGSERAPDGIDVRVPLDDVTPGELISGVITEAGLRRPPFAAAD